MVPKHAEGICMIVADTAAANGMFYFTWLMPDAGILAASSERPQKNVYRRVL